jgi:hypothetical protein
MDDTGRAAEGGGAGCARRGQAWPQSSLMGMAAGLACGARWWTGQADKGAGQVDDEWADEGTGQSGVRAD